MGNPTTEIRAKMDELGIAWVAIAETATEYAQEGIVYRAYEFCGGLQVAIVTPVTPEQAIAATVGRCDTMELWHEWEQVLFANVSDEVAQDNLNECVHELLDKAATVGVGTCKNTQDDFDFMCSECGKCVDNGRVLGFKFCPQCGRKIKEEAE